MTDFLSGLQMSDGIIILEHPEMKEMMRSIGETLRSPDLVVESMSDPSAKLYYRFYKGTMVGSMHLCVVVKNTEDDSFVIPAYLTDRTKKGKILWQGK